MSNLKALSMAAMLAFAGAAVAQDDSSSDVAAGYPAVVAESGAVVIRVPVDANGIENSTAAELRVTEAAAQSTAVEGAFEAGTPVVKAAFVDPDSDSSTEHSSYGWNNYNNYGYGSSYGGYNCYRPSYSYYTSNWSYSYSYTYTSYSYGHNYNYYYYPRSYRTCGGSNYNWGYRW